MAVLSFQKNFAAALVRGEKQQTIRQKRKHPFRVGDRITAWITQRAKDGYAVGDMTISKINPIDVIHHNCVICDGQTLSPQEIEALAIRDGFPDSQGFFDFFKSNYELPLTNLVEIQWKDLQLPPLLRWVGGKRRLAPIIEGYWQPYRDRGYRFVAPFCGSLGEVLALRPKQALLNDACAPLMNFWEYIKTGLDVPRTWSFDEAYFKMARSRFNELVLSGELTKETAQLFYYLNKAGFNGVYRCNAKGEYNAPMGRTTSGKPPKLPKSLRNYQPLFEDWQLTCRDFSTLEIGDRDFVYSDPPYDTLSDTANFTSYGVGTPFTWERQVEHAHWLASLDCPVLTSNHATARITALYISLGFKVRGVKVKRSVNSRADCRGEVQELLAYKSMETLTNE